jgi:hypothetical protein
VAKIGDLEIYDMETHGLFDVRVAVVGSGIRTLWKLEARPRRAPPPLATTCIYPTG